ncbi:hypothetical protein J2T60_001737 [Natronospira proteinivora]|uniref:Butirosin biosynthesis protein H-like n=1 Tax=Natronospira proteinivora TaxID=1807133 RepID=A0ABT1G9L4_9GAMM|nr:BtrH N-terminal domain-containing protein [Natronospira proteinivora]MCP1727737.1 hypothetical protein [Natronospira proteinivora]
MAAVATDTYSPGLIGVPTFEHQHAAHCETGVMARLLGHAGLPLSEPAAFGLSAAFTFAHLPMVRVNQQPLTSYRMPPGRVVRGLEKRLGLTMHRERFRDPVAGMQALDDHLAEGRPVGLQTSVYWLPYFPRDMRFHFNAHNLIVYGREGEDYLISDPVFDHPVRAPWRDLMKARFARGPFAPKGLIYYPEDFPKHLDWSGIARRAIRSSCNMMRYSPVPWIGLRGIRHLAKRLEKLSGKSLEDREKQLYVAQIIRMQEEIGTGGGGFRFLYAAFLQEAADWMQSPALEDSAALMAEAGEQWRDFALEGARYVKSGDPGQLRGLPEQLRCCAEQEGRALKHLARQL